MAIGQTAPFTRAEIAPSLSVFARLFIARSVRSARAGKLTVETQTGSGTRVAIFFPRF